MIIRGYQVNYIRCLTCEKEVQRGEDFYDVFVNVQTSDGFIKTLDEGIAKTYEPEALFNENAYFCSNCNSKQNAYKGAYPTSIGKYVSIYVNRFSFDVYTLQRVKLNKEVVFPLKIDLGAYIKDKTSDEKFEYELFGVIVHRGTPYSGHYYLVAKDIINEVS